MGKYTASVMLMRSKTSTIVEFADLVSPMCFVRFGQLKVRHKPLQYVQFIAFEKIRGQLARRM